jgi:GntR family transcriptional regulator/MocR family aminotransferase
MSHPLFHLDATLTTSLQQQLRQQIAQAILDHHIPPNSPLPSSRRLSQQLNVARNTVVLAYEHLLDDGYLIARERSGYFVNADILTQRVSLNSMTQKCSWSANKLDWNRYFKVRPTQQANITKPADWQKYDYPFIYGQFDPNLFPTNNWRECCRDNFSVPAIRSWASDHFVADDPMLIEQIHTRVLPRRGVWANPDQILITIGCQQGLYLLARLLLDQHSTIGLEDPGFVDIRNIASLNPAQIKPLPVDGQGLIIDDKLRDCDCVYVTPSHQHPTTVTMPLDRRQQLLDMASESDFLIIEDDYECETNFKQAPSPALKSLDRDERVIYIGSFSKILAPGLRLGYMVASKELIAEARSLRRLMLRHPPANNQRSIGLFIARGYYDALSRNLVNAYKERWHLMAEALDRHMPKLAEQPTFGGSCYWVQGPAGLDANQLKHQAAKAGILIEAGDIYFLSDQPPRNYFRMGYSSISPQRIEPGIAKLAKIMGKLV